MCPSRLILLSVVIGGLTSLPVGAQTTESTEAGTQDAARPAVQKENLLDPSGDFWAPRRGPHTELSVHLGPEGSLADFGGLDKRPQPSGLSLTVSGRYYPVGRLAISAQVRNFFGFDGFAAGTGAQTVISPLIGVRWDLVREGRFSLLVDVYSGPAFFAFADIVGALESLDARWALGAEFGAALPLRYSLGPFTFELRPTAGLRAGSASDIGRPTGDVGPFTAMYAGIDVGVTWSFWNQNEQSATP